MARINKENCAFWWAGQCNNCKDKCMYSTEEPSVNNRLVILCGGGNITLYNPSQTDTCAAAQKLSAELSRVVIVEHQQTNNHVWQRFAIYHDGKQQS